MQEIHQIPMSALVNISKNEVLDEKVVLCGSWWRQARGLILRPRKSAVMLFSKSRRVPLHMFGVLYPIDVMVLDKSKRVKEIKEDFRPFTFYTPNEPGYYIVEVPHGRLGATEIGDVLAFP